MAMNAGMDSLIGPPAETAVSPAAAAAVSGAAACPPPVRATWTDFCEHHAASAADEFAWDVSQYVHENPEHSAQNFAKKYTEYFMLHFDMHVIAKRWAAGNISSIVNG